MKKMISIVAAVSKNGAIGNKGKLPWHIPEDLRRFKELTSGNAVLMGRKTFESILGYLGKPLPNRKNIVITRQEEYAAFEGVLVYKTIEDALQKHRAEDIYVIGGAEMYAQTIGLADKLYITEVHQEIEGDAFFPSINPNEWKEISREDCKGYSFVEYAKSF